MEDNSPRPGRSTSRWIPSWLGWGLLVLGVILAIGLLAQLFTDRLTIHNRTTVPIEFTSDSLGGYPNYVAACTSAEFKWESAGHESGWIPPDGLRHWQGGAVRVEVPSVRGFEFTGGGDHFAVVVTSKGVAEAERDLRLPPCEGEPPE